MARFGAAGPLGHGCEPVPDVPGGDGVRGQMAEGGEDVLAHHVGALRQRPRFPVPGVAFEDLLGEGVHGVAGGPGAAVVLHGVREGSDQAAGLARRLGHTHGAGAADGGVAPAPARHAGEGEDAHPAGKDTQGGAGDYVVADVVAPVAGPGGRTRRAKVDFGLSVMGNGSSFEPRDRAVMQEAVAAAFRRGSRATGGTG